MQGTSLPMVSCDTCSALHVHVRLQGEADNEYIVMKIGCCKTYSINKLKANVSVHLHMDAIIMWVKRTI